jgi:HK97 family phage portal protein
MRLVAVYACIGLISDAIRGMPVDLFQNRNGIAEELPPTMWLEMPNPDQTWGQFIDMGMHQLLSRGNLFVLLGPRDLLGYPTEMTPIDPNVTPVQVRRVSGQKKVYVGGMPLDPYSVRDPGGQILHVLNHSSDGLTGLAPIELAKQAIGLGLAQDKHGAKFFGQGVQTTGVVQLPPGAKPEKKDIEALGKSFRRKYAGTQNAWRPIILANGATYNPISVPNDQAQFIESRKFSVSEIARIFRVPPHLIGDLEKSTSWGTGIEQQSIGFVTYTLTPWLTRLEEAFSSIAPRGQYVKFNANALLRGDQKARFEAYQIGILNGFVTRNEVRGFENQAPIEGLDAPLLPMNLGALGEGDGATTITVAIGTLIRAGWEPDSAREAVITGDYSKLVHTGLVPITIKPEEALA